jgi:hypothetical protein
MTLTPSPNLFAAWREADALARSAEASVLNASLRALDGHGQPPTLDERACAKALRDRADDLLAQVFRNLPPAKASVSIDVVRPRSTDGR